MSNDSMNGNGADINDLFPGAPLPKDELASRKEKALKTLERSIRHGWQFAELSPWAKAALGEATWAKAFGHYVWESYTSNTRVAPDWLVVLIDALVPKYRTSYRSKHGEELSQLGKVGDFVSMLVGWCAAGGKTALEDRARPLASVIMLAGDRKDVERKANHLINEVGF